MKPTTTLYIISGTIALIACMVLIAHLQNKEREQMKQRAISAVTS